VSSIAKETGKETYHIYLALKNTKTDVPYLVKSAR